MKKILVTGGLGFIGSNLIELLIKKKFFVINIDKITYSSNFYNTKNFKNSKFYKFIKCDIGEKKIYKILKKYKPNCIFNLAAETHVDRSIDKPERFIKSNILSTYNLFEAFRKFSKDYKSKLIHISTDEVFGDLKKGKASENYPYKPSSPYAASKASSNHLANAYIRTFKTPIIITNCSNNYGPRQHPEKFIPKLIFNILNNKPLPIYGNGKNSREWIYVKDHCNALLKIYRMGKLGCTYNIGSKINLTNIKVCKKIIDISKKIMKIKKIKTIFVKDRPGHDFRYSLDTKKIRNELGWVATTKFEKGIYLTFKWYNLNKSYYDQISKKDIVKRLGNHD